MFSVTRLDGPLEKSVTNSFALSIPSSSLALTKSPLFELLLLVVAAVGYWLLLLGRPQTFLIMSTDYNPTPHVIPEGENATPLGVVGGDCTESEKVSSCPDAIIMEPEFFGGIFRFHSLCYKSLKTNALSSFLAHHCHGRSSSYGENTHCQPHCALPFLLPRYPRQNIQCGRLSTQIAWCTVACQFL